MYIPRVWLITSASSGLGMALTEVVLREGDIVVAILDRPSALAHLIKDYPPSQLLILTLDVSRPADISTAFSRIEEAFGRLDVVFNNAEYGMLGEVEGTPDAAARALFDVNFWGVVGVSREAVRFFREVNSPGQGGVLFQHSSVMGFLGAPGISFYCARHGRVYIAVDGFSESLSKELPMEWNIKVCILQTSRLDTNVIATSHTFPLHPAYINSVAIASRDAYRNMAPDEDSYKFAEMLYQLIVRADHGKKIPLFLPIGEDELERMRAKMKRLDRVPVDVGPWSAGLKKDGGEYRPKL